jgi:hypothetical protein
MERAADERGSRSWDRMSGGGKLAVVAGFALHAAMGVVVLVSGLIMPIWAVGVLAVVWLAALAVAIRWRGRPPLVLLVPFAMLAIWGLTAWLGDTFLDWTP